MQVTGIRIVEIKNYSAITEFILLGLTDSPEIQILLFWLFTFIYVVALSANFLLIFTISTFKKLHTPMYFLILNLSLVNIFSISVTVPRLLQSLSTNRKMISFYGCITQVFFIIWALGSEMLLLSFMAFDRYAAICHPLHYTIIMRKEVCVIIAAIVWIAGMIDSALHAGLMLRLSFCDSNVINHFFCDIPPMLDLACSDTSINQFMTMMANVVFGICSCGLTLTSYCFILMNIFRIHSAEGKKKAFSTCSSHLIVITLYFTALIYTYIRPSSVYSPDKDKLVSLIYLVITPVVNPIIYSLRNKDFKEGMKIFTGYLRLLPKP